MWIWWINEPDRLTATTLCYLDNFNPPDICVSNISCWEVAKLVEKGRLELAEDLAN
ncbi:hypothetical protein ACFSUS_13190 [Spirosoma soli]|uniref:Uncharacterized protein n=1 Tax=Spirosoma soli TaxID=1770529 RepID=A0ABW5M3K7_9BACT